MAFQQDGTPGDTGGPGGKGPLRICVCGPSYVGKTQLINRLINNQFYAEYYPTTEMDTYKMTYDAADSAFLGAKDAHYVQLEIIDLFPTDHPMLFQDPNTNKLAKKMQETLRNVVKNKENANSPKWFHAYIFVFDVSDKQSYDSLLRMIDGVREHEKTQQRGNRRANLFTPHKVVVGNKKDLKTKKQTLTEDDLRKLDNIMLKQVSALENFGVSEVFGEIVSHLLGNDAISSNTNVQDPNMEMQDDMTQNEEEQKSQVERDQDSSDEESEENQFRVNDPSKKKIKGFESYNANLIDRGRMNMKKKIQNEQSSTTKAVLQTFMPFLFSSQTPGGDTPGGDDDDQYATPRD